MSNIVNPEIREENELSPEVSSAYEELKVVLPSPEAVEKVNLEDLRRLANTTGEYSKVLGKWPQWKKVADSIGYRIPGPGETKAQGMDAGLAYCLGIVPHGEAGALVSRLHQNHFMEDHDLLLEEMQKDSPNPDSPAVWYLAMCTLCEEEGLNDEAKFRKYLKMAFELRDNPALRLEAAKKMFNEFQNTNPVAEIAIQESTGDLIKAPLSIGWAGFLGAYNKGYRITTMYSPNDGFFFIGTVASMKNPEATSMANALKSFNWKNPDVKGPDGKIEKRGTSGLITGNFLKCADKEELYAVLDAIARDPNAEEIFKNCKREKGDNKAGELIEQNRSALTEILK